MQLNGTRQSGFTLIELSIVLVIIGLIVGGVLVGRDLINAAAARAQISQIEKYNTAVNTFYGKYGGLPGDLNATSASQFGFAARGPYRGQGDGNGVLEGNSYNDSGGYLGFAQVAGENAMFWVDLSAAGLIEGQFNTASETALVENITGAAIAQYLPVAKLGQGNYVYTYSGGWNENSGNNNSQNYYGLSFVNSIGDGACPECIYVPWPNPPGLTVQQAYSIDKKIDDGLPASGNVLASFLDSNNFYWGKYTSLNSGPPTSAITGTSSTCFDNGNMAGAVQVYSTEQNGGNGVNCGLSFRFQ